MNQKRHTFEEVYDGHMPSGPNCRARVRSAKRQVLIDQLEALHRKPTAAPTVPAEVAISTALSMFVPGPADLISATGTGVNLIKRALSGAGYKIVPMEREDYGS